MRSLRYLPLILFHYLLLNYTPIIYVQLYVKSYSLNYGIIPSIFKQAIITPILKKPSLDPKSLFNYRTISQLPSIVN